MIAELRGHKMNSTQQSQAGLDSTPCLCVVDAKDVHDKITKDTASWGSMKSMAYTIAGLKQTFRRPNMSLRWTATENMFVDAGTKDMDTSHYAKILQTGLWSVTYCSTFIKAKKTARISNVEVELEVLPGSVVIDVPLQNLLNSCIRQNGWINDNPLGKILIARNAKSFRTSEPRFAVSSFPYRSSYAYFNWRGSGTWRMLEYKASLANWPNPHSSLPATAAVLVTVFCDNAA